MSRAIDRQAAEAIQGIIDALPPTAQRAVLDELRKTIVARDLAELAAPATLSSRRRRHLAFRVVQGGRTAA